MTSGLGVYGSHHRLPPRNPSISPNLLQDSHLGGITVVTGMYFSFSGLGERERWDTPVYCKQ